MKPKRAFASPFTLRDRWRRWTGQARQVEALRRHANACMPECQLMMLSATLDAERARLHLPNLVMVEQTLRAAVGQGLALVPNLVLVRALSEVRALAGFEQSDSLHALHESIYWQALRNEHSMGHVQGFDDFQDTVPHEC